MENNLFRDFDFNLFLIFSIFRSTNSTRIFISRVSFTRALVSVIISLPTVQKIWLSENLTVPFCLQKYDVKDLWFDGD